MVHHYMKVLSNVDNFFQKVKDLKKEIQMLTRLKHDNIVAFYFSEQTVTKLSIFMEYVSGVSLIFYLS